MREDRQGDRERRKREREEKKRREREEKARRREELRELREARKREKLEALRELSDLPAVERGEGEELRCAPGRAEGAWDMAREEATPGGVYRFDGVPLRRRVRPPAAPTEADVLARIVEAVRARGAGGGR